MDNFTVNDILDTTEVGSIIPLLVQIDDKDVPIFFIKDYEDSLKNIEDNDLIALKNSILGNDDCTLFLLIFKFADNFDTTYDVWFNYSEPWHREFLAELKESNRIIIDFRNEDNERIKSIEIENTINDATGEYVERCLEDIVLKGAKDENVINLVKKKKYETWGIREANNFLDMMFETYESVEELWDEL